MAGIFRKAFGNRQKIKPVSEKKMSNPDGTVEDGQTSESVNVELIARFKTLKQDIQVAASGKDKGKAGL